ncbi:MAG: branched-chain amino acid ABC transporter permease [Pseudomonadota bacterium]
MEPKTEFQRRLREFWPLLILCAVVILVVLGIQALGDAIVSRSLTEALIRLVVVVGLFVFIGNSGLMSFGHIAFMMIGAYATAWQTMPVMTKGIFAPGLPDYLLQNSHHWLPATLAGGVAASMVAVVAGVALMRLSGIAASIGTFAFLMVFYSFYLQWSTWTAGQSSLVGLPVTTTPWVGLAFSIGAIIVAFFYARSRFGLALRATREDAVAAQAAGVNVTRQRLVAFVVSAFICGIAGGLYGHFLGLLTVDTFGLPLTFICIAMLVVGGINSLSGAVIGTLFVSFVIEFLRTLESGLNVGVTIDLPANSAEVGLGVILLLMLIFRPTGLTKNQEIYWPWRPITTAAAVSRRQS